MKTNFEHAAVVTRDIDASIHFYRDLLGGIIVREGNIPSSGTRLAYLQFGDGMIELLGRPNPGPGTTGIDHVAFQVEDLDAMHARMSGDAVRFTTPPKAAGSGVGRIAFLEDPDGIRVELLKQPSFRREEKERNGARLALDLDHVSLRVENLNASHDFYAKYFNASTAYFMDLGSRGIVIDYLDAGFGVLGLKATTDGEPHPDGPRLAHLCFRVRNVDEASDALKAKGVKFDVEPRKSAAPGDYKVSVCLDPDGTRIELQDRPDFPALASTQAT